MGKIYTVSGPRGVGKTHTLNRLSECYGIDPIAPYTTRDMREDEQDGREYNFVSQYEFDAINRTEGMFDVLTIGGNSYGTPMTAFDKVVGDTSGELGSVKTVNLAASSALQLRDRIGESSVKSVFLLPASWADIDLQMREMGISEEQIAQRRSVEPTDLTMLPRFDRIILNEFGEAEKTVKSMREFIGYTAGLSWPE